MSEQTTTSDGRERGRRYGFLAVSGLVAIVLSVVLTLKLDIHNRDAGMMPGSSIDTIAAVSLSPSATSNTTIASTSGTSNTCCFRSATDFSADFFDKKFGQVEMTWSGSEYQQWLNYSSSTPMGNALNHIDSQSCEVQWYRVVMDQVYGYYLQAFLTDLEELDRSRDFGYVEDKPGLPRILLLGDSVSIGTWVWTQAWFHNLANIHSAPTSCIDFDTFNENLDAWLGDCQWDSIQFNIGLHLWPGPQDDPNFWNYYVDGLKMIIVKLRQHSPEAHIIFATTTPSPVDRNPMPTLDECPENYYTFPERGVVSELNKVAKQVCAEQNVTVVDRYAMIQPFMQEMMYPCNLHYTEEGYQELAALEWKTHSDLFGLPMWPPCWGGKKIMKGGDYQ